MDDQSEFQNLINTQPSFLPKFKLFLSRNKFAIIFIASLSILSFGSTTYLLMTNKKPLPPSESFQENIASIPTTAPSAQKAIITSAQPLSTPTPIVLVDPTATWSAFVSSKYSYSIKYPPGWNAKITVQQDPKILEYVVFNPIATKAGTLSITLSYETRSYLQALALDPQTGKTIIIASVSATEKSSKDSNGNKATSIIVPAGLNSIILNAKNFYASLFNQMLSTLKLPE